MSKKVKTIVLRTAGTNCDQETAFAFQEFGAQADLVHINELFEKKASIEDYHIIAIPGGFTYGDDIEAGRILANELRLRLGEQIRQFVDSGRCVIGICNGFQVLVKTGFLPGGEGSSQQNATLMSNDSGKFEDRWTRLSVHGNSVWTKGLGSNVFFPVAHAEGKFVPKDQEVLNALRENNQIIFRYTTAEGTDPDYPDNPNGSVDHIAGISDPTGRILGLMPHPERHFLFIHHPFWTRLSKNGKYGDGAKIFENGVRHIKEHIL